MAKNFVNGLSGEGQDVAKDSTRSAEKAYLMKNVSEDVQCKMNAEAHAPLEAVEPELELFF